MTQPPLALPRSGLPFLRNLCVAPPAQAYHASRLRRFCQTVFASSDILPAGCLYGWVVPCCHVLLGAMDDRKFSGWLGQQAGYTFHCAEMWGAGGDDHPGVCASALDGHSRTRQRSWKPRWWYNHPIHPTGCVDNEATFTTFSLLSQKVSSVHLSCSTAPPLAQCSWRATEPPPCRGTELGIASGIGAYSTSAASCRTGVIQYVVPHVPPLLRSFPILIVKHHEQQDVEVRNSKWNFLFLAERS